MSKVRVLVGTKKGAFILSADGKRDKWDISGPHFAGWEIYHMKARWLIRTGCMPRKLRAGSDKSSSAPTMAARHGTSRERLRVSLQLRAGGRLRA